MYTHGLAEYLGTCLLIGSIAFTTNPLFVVAAFAIAIGLGKNISGAHFNPAVTIWAFMSGKISQSRAIMHTVAHVAAALTVWGVHSMIKV